MHLVLDDLAIGSCHGARTSPYALAAPRTERPLLRGGRRRRTGSGMNEMRRRQTVERAFQVPAPGFVLSAIKGLSHIAPKLGVLR